jgi:4-methyl-5(b-hydroxyethyl)-thiazole monophosphate biosynthesis
LPPKAQRSKLGFCNEKPIPKGVGFFFGGCMPNALVCVADGSEEIETLGLVDVLRRAGVAVTLAGLKPGPLTLSRQVRILADAELDAVIHQEFDLIAIPGGPGHAAMMDDPRIMALLQRQHSLGKWCAAICAGPKVLAKAGLLSGRSATCYPGALESMAMPEIRILPHENVVVDGNLVTSKGPGTTLAWALTLAGLLTTVENKVKMAAAMQCPELAG